MQSELSRAKELNMKLVPSLLVLAIVGGVVPAAEAGQNARLDTPAGAAGATATQVALQKYDRVIGVCHLSANPFDPTSAVNVLTPQMAIKNYYRIEEHYMIEGQASISVLSTPTHGVLEGPVNGAYVYYPEKGYLGNDRATLLVEVGGKKIRMEYFFRVMTTVFEGEGSDPYADNCPEKVDVWKISTIIDIPMATNLLLTLPQAVLSQLAYVTLTNGCAE